MEYCNSFGAATALQSRDSNGSNGESEEIKAKTLSAVLDFLPTSNKE